MIHEWQEALDPDVIEEAAGMTTEQVRELAETLGRWSRQLARIADDRERPGAWFEIEATDQSWRMDA